MDMNKIITNAENAFNTMKGKINSFNKMSFSKKALIVDLVAFLPVILLLVGALLIIIGKYAPWLYLVATAGVVLKIKSKKAKKTSEKTSADSSEE